MLGVSLKSNKENRFMMAIIIFAGLLFVLSFTSKLWLYDDEPIYQTAFNEEIKALNQTTLSLLSWKHNKDKEFMEVIITKKYTGGDLVKPTFNYKVEEYEKGEIGFEKILESEELVVLKIEGFSKKFKKILITIEELRDEETIIVEQKELNPDLDIDEIKLPEPEAFTFVGDYRKLEVDNKLVIKNKKDYQKERLEFEIANLEKEINFINNERIPLEQKLALELESKIETLKEDMEFQTTEEKEESLFDIEGYENDIVNVLENIKLFEEQVESIEEKIENYHKRIKKLESENVDVNEKKQVEDLEKGS